MKKVAIVTGASRGIGKAIALQLAKNQYNLVLSYNQNTDEANHTKEECEELDAKVELFKGDLSMEENCKALIDVAINTFGKIDLLVNNAGSVKDNLILKMSTKDFVDVINTNLVSVFNCCKFVSQVMVKQRYGNIINISSVSGISGNAGQANYASAKAGVIGLTKTLAKELAKRNIVVNAIAPGFIDTDMTKKFPEKAIEQIKTEIPLNKIGQAEDIASTVEFLANSSYITGQVIIVDGGISL